MTQDYEDPKPERRIIESGKCHYMTKDGRDIIYDYTIEIDKTGKKRMYASQPGKCIELDPETNEFIDLVYSGGPPPKDI